MSHFCEEMKKEFEEMKQKRKERKDLTASYKLIKYYWRAYLSGIDGDSVKKRDVEFLSTRDIFVKAVEMRAEQELLIERQRDHEKQISQSKKLREITCLLERVVLH